MAGHSLGGGIVLQYALDYPEDLAGIIPIGSGGRLKVHPDFLKMLETPLIFIGPRNPEELGQSLSLANWSKVPVIMPKRGLSKKRCERWFAQKKIAPAIYSSVAGNEAMIAMVAMGCGIGVVPRLVLENSPLRSRVRVLDVRPALDPFSVGACSTRSLKRRPAVQAFWHIAEQEILNRYTSRGIDENHSDNK